MKKKQEKPDNFLGTKTASIALILIIFISIFSVHRNGSYNQSGDSRWSIPTALSLINEGNANLDEFSEIVQANSNECVNEFGGHLYTIFPIGVSIIALPFVFIFNSELIQQISMFPQQSRQIFASMEITISAFVIALAGVMVFLIARKHLNIRYSLLLVFVFAFCTSAWSTASRALWQHGPSMLMLLVSLYLTILAKNKQSVIQFVSIPLIFSYVIRPTNSVSIILLSIFVLMQYRRYSIKYLLWGLSVVIPFLIYNYNVYQFLLPPYYLPGRIGSNPQFFEALAGNLISPGRGLFVFSPVLLLAIVGIILKVKGKQVEKLDLFLIGIIVLHWITISSFPLWTAGWSFGPRFFSDMIPYFIYFLIPVLAKISKLRGLTKSACLSGLTLLVAVSFFIHFRGATDVQTFLWNADVDGNIAKIWSWRDLQFLRGF